MVRLCCSCAQAIIVSIVCLGSLETIAIARGNPPILRLKQSTFDAGTITRGRVLVATFVLMNDGGSPLRISNVRPGCGCLDVRLTRTVVDSGDESEMRVAIDTESLSEGRINIAMGFDTNDPRRPSEVVFITAVVRSQFSVEPRGLDFGAVSRGTTAVRHVSIRVLDQGSAAIVGVSSTVKMVSAAVRSIDERHGYYQLSVTLSAHATVGWHFGAVLVHTTGETPLIRIPVKAIVR